MFSGLADDAAARGRDLRSVFGAGGVIDQIPEVAAAETGHSSVLNAVIDDDVWYVRQLPGDYLVFNHPRQDRDTINTPPMRRAAPPPVEPPTLPTPLTPQPLLSLRFQRLSRLTVPIDEEEQTITLGRLTEESPIQDLIEDALRMIPRDDWRFSTSDPRGIDRSADDAPLLRESSRADVLDQESRVRIIPGEGIAEHNLRVEKFYPAESTGSEITLEITVMNQGSSPISGVIVKEFLPRDTRVRAAMPEPLRRGAGRLNRVPEPLLNDDTLTWLLEDLEPFVEQTIRFTVMPSIKVAGSSRKLRFESSTEVSGVSAASARTVVRGEVRRMPETPPERRPIPDEPAPRRPRVIARPEIRLQIQEPPSSVAPGAVAEVIFRISNIGTAPAEGVDLRVKLASGLTHHQLDDNDPVREITNGVRRLEPGETRAIPLRMTAPRAGTYRCTAEMLFEGEQLVQEQFRIIAR
jgi:uncharacterized repeat protein (TIGR01451 family)